MNRRTAIIAAVVALVAAAIGGLVLASSDDDESAPAAATATGSSAETTTPVAATDAPTTTNEPAAAPDETNPAEETGADDSDDEPDTDSDTDVADEPVVEPAAASEKYTVCVSVVHAPPADAPEFLSRLEVDVDAGPTPRELSIVIPGANGDQPNVTDVATENAVLGINSYGDYRFGTVLLGGVDVSAVFGGLPTISVNDQEQTLFCEDVRGNGPGGYADQVDDFISEFNAAHETGDVDALLAGLHPAARDAFTPEACDLNIRQSTGAIRSIELVEIGPIAPFELPGPDGPLVFPEAVEVEVNWVVEDEPIEGATFHLVLESDDVFYLSTCGQPAP